MESGLRVYLAGPIRGCDEEQRTGWRKEVKQRLDREFDFDDPSEWAEDGHMPLEIAKLGACDLVLANMWKESIGTTVGIVRASQQGKPVVLIDPSRLNNAILNRLVDPQMPVYTLDEACSRLTELAASFKPFEVLKRGGSEQLFMPDKVTRSVSLAAAAAGETDAGFEELISGPVIAGLRLDGSQRGLVTTEEIRTRLLRRLEWMTGDTLLPKDVRGQARAVLQEWEKGEVRKGGERAAEAAKHLIADLHTERSELLRALAAQEARIHELERHPPAEAEPPPASLTEALERLGRDFPDSIVVHEHALKTALNSPYLDIDRAGTALQLLGRYASEMQVDEPTGHHFAGRDQWFEAHKDEAWLEYAAKEGKTTRAKYRRERTIIHDGVPLFAEEHLCLGDSHDAQYCLRIHFVPHKDRIIVAYCGRHLRTKGG